MKAIKLSSEEETWRACQVPHFIAIAALSLHIDPENNEALRTNNDAIYARAMAMIAGMDSYLTSLQNQQSGHING
jgi:hypothetical protein